jgi:hypothetical protein
MKKNKTAQLDTTTLILDFKQSNLVETVQIWEYDLPKSMPIKGNENYAQIHIWAKNQTDNPYYLHTPTLKLYIVYSGKQVEDIFYTNEILVKRQIPHFQNNDINPCLIKALLAHYVHETQRFVSNYNFYLFVKSYNSQRGNHYADVLEINPKIPIQKDIQNNDTGLFELLLDDSATRLKRTEFKNRNKSQVPFDYIELPNGQLAFNQLKTKGVAEDKLIYEKNTSDEYKTKVTFHSIKSVEDYEKSRNNQLAVFTNGFLEHLQNLGISVSQKTLYLEQKELTLGKNSKLPLSDFKVSVFDKRFVKKDDFQEILNVLNDTSYEVKFYSSSENEAFKEDNILILMDYSTGDCTNDGVLRSKIDQDGYKVVKNAGFLNSQGFCININTFNKTKIESSEEEFLTYEFKDEKKAIFLSQIERNLEICLQQLFLKSLIHQQNTISKNLPNADIIAQSVFIHCYTKDNERFKQICFVEDNLLRFENLYSPKSLQILNSFGIEGDTMEDVMFNFLSLRKGYDKYNWSKIDKNEIRFILNPNGIIEIMEIPEKTLYSSEVRNVLVDRETVRPRKEFELEHENSVFSDEQITAFNNYLKKNVENEISFEKLLQSGKNGTHREEICNILGIKNETKLRDELKYKGKKAGFFATSQGIWFDKKSSQYFVGSNSNYQDYTQEKGFQMRKIITLRGEFDAESFFPLLSVDFVKYRSFTVNPYVFNLIKMYNTMNR